MKVSTLMSLFFVLLLALSTVGAVSATLSTSADVLLGDKKERASNPEADDLADRVADVTTSLSIINSGNSTITGISFQVLPAAGFPLSDTLLVITNVPTSLDAGATASIIVSGVLPADLDAVDSNRLRESAFTVATLTLTGTEGTTAITKNIEIKMQRENQLTIDDVDVCVNGQCVSVDDGDDVENIRPGDRVELTFIVENDYSDSDSEDLDIEDVQLEWEIDDDDLDEDDDEDIGDISADDKEEESFAFTIDDDIPAGSYTVTARVFGKDENNALHGHEIEFDLEVERDRHDITLRRVTASPSILSCSASSRIVSFSTSYVNIGRDDEDDVVISVENDEFGINEQIGPISLDEDDSRADTIRVTIPQDARPDTYVFKVKSFHSSSIQSDEEQLQITVPDCSNTQQNTVVVTPTTTQPPVVVQPPVVNQPPQTPPTAPRRSVIQDDESSSAYMVVLALGVLLLLALVIGGFVALRRRN